MVFYNHNNPLDSKVGLDNKKLSDRAIRGYSILAKGDLPKAVDEETFIVPSQSSDKKYKVVLHKKWSCECPDFQKRKLKCKHIHAVEFLLKMRAKVDESGTLPLDEEILNETKCAYCKSYKVKKNGKRKIENGIKQRYFCLDCKRTFIQDSEFARISADPKIVTLAMDLYYKGLSLREISDTLKQFYNIEVSHGTIRNWITKFSQRIDEYTKQLTPKVSDAWHVDEQMIKSKGKDRWLWNIIDEQTRFLIANNITNTRYISDAREVFKKAKGITKTRPEFMITDGLHAYEQALRKEFVTHHFRRNNVEHIRLASIRSHIHNNLIERFHGTFRERDKVMRGFKGGEEVFSDGFRNYYNFIRPHMSLGITPAEASGIDLELGRNRWLSLLKKSI